VVKRKTERLFGEPRRTPSSAAARLNSHRQGNFLFDFLSFSPEYTPVLLGT
jgi:hypothetical protein